MKTLSDILPLLLPFVGGGGLVVAWQEFLKWKAAQPKSEAEARKIYAEITMAPTLAWENLYERSEARIVKMEKDLELVRSQQLDQERLYRQMIRQKDDEIDKLFTENRELKAENRALDKRVNTLEEEVKRLEGRGQPEVNS